MQSQQTLLKQKAFEKALTKGDVDQLATLWTGVAENTLADFCVTVDGHPQCVKGGHRGRVNLDPFKSVQNFVPHSKRARNGDYRPLMDQCSVELRRGSKQLHRLQSLVRQVRNLNSRFSHKAFLQAEHLWQTILNAHGFHQGFRNWIAVTFQLFLPSFLPTYELICELKDLFEAWHSHKEKQTWLQKTKVKAINIALDLPKGGKLAFKETKTQALPPVNQIQHKVQCKVMKIPWPKDGHNVLRGGPFDELDPNLPVVFQGQIVSIHSITSGQVTLDKPVRLKDASCNAMVLSHDKISVKPAAMHERLQGAWNHYFCRDDPSSIDKPNEEGLNMVNRIPTCQLASLPSINGPLLKEAINSTKVGSGRGSDGFSTLDLKKLPAESLLELLALIFTLVEKCGRWPSQWSVAKTICLPKVAGPCGP